MGSTPRGISGSRAAAVLGLSEFTSRFEVWQQIKEEREPGFNARRGYILPVFEGNASTRWGLAFEDAVIQLAEQATGATIMNREQEYFYHLTPGLPFTSGQLTCHVDGEFLIDGDFFGQRYDKHLHNGKTTNSISFRNKWGEPGTAAVPQSYAIQAQHDMMVSGAEQTILSVLVFPETPDNWETEGGWLPMPIDNGKWMLIKNGVEPRDPMTWAQTMADQLFFKQYIIPADKSAQEAMLESYRKFWRDHIDGDAEPTPETPEDIARAFPAPVGTLIATDQIAAWIAERNAITDEIGGKGPLSKRKDQLKVDILNWARAQDAQVDDDSREKTIILSAEGKRLASWNGTTFR